MVCGQLHRPFNTCSTQYLLTFSISGSSSILMMSLCGLILIMRPCLTMNLFLNGLPNSVFSLNQPNVFLLQDLEILGHHVTPLGRFPTSKGTEAISAMPHPRNVSSVKPFLDMVNYFRDYVRNMASRTKHLYSLLCKGISFG